ncbi:MAG: hypothetical protein IJD48_02675 [Clostridia bacterium]|nr:hypothetical protein [Clostridia bacterium]
MAHVFYTGKPTLIPKNTAPAKAYNDARQNLNIEYLGDFFYEDNFPIQAKNCEVGKKYPADGAKCQFGFWKVVNKGDFILRNRPGERVVPSPDGREYLVSYVVTPRMCSDDRASELPHGAFYVQGHEYQDIVDPGAVALATNGKGLVRDIASAIVDDRTADVKTTLKIGTTTSQIPGEVVFLGFGNANHCDTMIQSVLRNSLPEVYADFPGEVKPASLDPTLNADLYERYDIPNPAPQQN